MSEEQKRKTTIDSACRMIKESLFSADDKKWKEGLCNMLGIPHANMSEDVVKQLDAVKASLQAIAKGAAETKAPAIESQRIAGDALLACVPECLETLNNLAVVPDVREECSRLSFASHRFAASLGLQHTPQGYNAIPVLQKKLADLEQSGNTEEKLQALHKLCAAHARCISWWKNKDSTKAEKKQDIMGKYALVNANMTSKAKELAKRGDVLATEMTALEVERKQLDQMLQAKMRSKNEKLTVSDCLDAFQEMDTEMAEGMAQRKALAAKKKGHGDKIRQNGLRKAYLKSLHLLLAEIRKTLSQSQQKADSEFAVSRSSMNSKHEAGMSRSMSLPDRLSLYSSFSLLPLQTWSCSSRSCW
jgi:hypothetical protein